VLNAEYGIQPEMATLHNVLLIVSLGNTRGDIDRVVRAFEALRRRAVLSGRFGRPAVPRSLPTPSGAPDAPDRRLSPRSAFYAPTETIPFESSAGRTSAELVAPYPPGVPILAPGEVISREAVEYLRAVERLGGLINGPEDAALRTIKVIASR
jgi:arginine decarboxylase